MPLRYAPLLLALSLAPMAVAQSGEVADLAAFWTGTPRWLHGSGGETSFGGINRGRYGGLGPSTVGPDGDLPVVVRFDSTETTLMGRALFNYCAPFNVVSPFRGSAWDVSDPASPRRLNMLLIELDDAPMTNGVWDPGEYLLVMASTYDGTGTSYATSCRLNPLDTVYVLRLYLYDGQPAYVSSPAELRIEPAFIRAFTPGPSNGAVTLSWTYERPDGDAFRLYRRSTDIGPGTLLTTLPISARSYTDEGLALDSTYTYRAEAVDAAGQTRYVSDEAHARPHVSENMELVGTLDPRPSGSYYGDIWGYVSPTGREYALLTSSASGLSVIDVTAEPPVEVGFVPTAPGASDSKDVEVYGAHAYLVNEYGPIQIIDLADPTNPIQVGLLNTQPSTPSGGTHTLSIVDGHLYAQGGRSPGGVRIYSLADPVHPAFVGEYQPAYVHDVYVRNDTLYAARIRGEGVDIVDLSDKGAPHLIANFNYPNSGAHNVCMSEDGRYAFVGDEVGLGPWTRAFDVRDPLDVELVAEIIVNPNAIVHNCNVSEDLLYIAHYTEGVRVWDVSDPRNPAEVAFYDTYVGSYSGFAGAWSVYPYLPSGKLIASDMDRGLFVLRLTNGVPNEPDASPARGLMLRAWPNPSRDGAHLALSLPSPADVRLAVYDLLGREVAMLHEGPLAAGEHVLSLDTAALSAGLYLARVTGNSFAASQRLTVIR